MSRCGILNLPIEILDLIYKYIPYMRHKLNFAKAHGVLGNAFAFHVGDIFKEIDINKRPIQEWSDILSLCGSSVTRIETEAVNTTVDVVKLASMYCPNLEVFFFPVRSSFWELIKPMLLTLQNLVWIKLENNFEKVNVVETLLQLPKLKKLYLIGFKREDFEQVVKIRNLTELGLRNAKEISCLAPFQFFSIESNDIFEFKTHAEEQLWPNIELLHIAYMDFHTSLPYWPTLKDLTISKTRMSLDDVFGESVFSYGKTLETLDIIRQVHRFIKADDIGIITKLKALKKLSVQLGGDDCLQFISQLENLEELTLGCSEITNLGAMMVIKRCKKLRVLDVTGCSKVNSSVVMEAVAALSLRPKEDNPFVLRVDYEFGHFDESKLGGVLDIQYDTYIWDWFIEDIKW